MKSIDGGVTYKPVFDKYAQSIGAVTIDQAHPDTVWVGTGEGDTRNSVSVGTGVYRSDDGGDDWKLMGLPDSERIAHVAIDPADSNTVFVAALGHLWNDNAERGLFRTTDGGKTWQKVLFVNASTGCADVAIDPKNPKRIYAAMWDFRRRPILPLRRPRSGLWRSVDGGLTRRGSRRVFRAAISAESRSRSLPRPETVYATIESSRTRSTAPTTGDVEDDQYLLQRRRASLLFRISRSIRAIPSACTSPVLLTVSDDGGKSFSGGSGFDFGAYHLTPTRSGSTPPTRPPHARHRRRRVRLARPGRTVAVPAHPPGFPALPRRADDARPYNVYGGFQDNGCWYGPSAGESGIGNDAWKNYGFGDGMYTFPDPTDGTSFWEYQGGEMYKFLRRSRETKQIRPYRDPATRRCGSTGSRRSSSPPPIRICCWPARSISSPRPTRGVPPDLGRLDDGRSRKQRQVESGGLTPDDSAAENHCTIYAIGASPLDRNLIWAGTDDGNLQLTRDGGAHWQNVVSAVPGLPKGTWVSGLEPSRFDKGTVYATFDNHARGDFARTSIARPISGTLGLRSPRPTSKATRTFSARTRNRLPSSTSAPRPASISRSTAERSGLR